MRTGSTEAGRGCDVAGPAPQALAMKDALELITITLLGGVFLVVPVYLAVLLVLKAMRSVGGLVRPIAALLPVL